MDIRVNTPHAFETKLPEIKEFLIENKDLVETDNYDQLYEKTDYHGRIRRRDLTYLFLISNINPLNYVTEIPPGFYDGISGIDSIIVPKNIKTIDTNAFSFSSIKEIKIESTNIKFDRHIVNELDFNIDISYPGSKTNFYGMVTLPMVDRFNDFDIIIHCTDGNINASKI